MDWIPYVIDFLNYDMHYDIKLNMIVKKYFIN